MKIVTSRITDAEPELLFEEVLNDKGNPVYTKDYEQDPPTEKVFKYDGDKLVLEIEAAEGQELSRTEFVYNEKGNILEIRLLLGGILYQRTTTQYLPDGLVETKFIDGEEVERIVVQNAAEGSKTLFFVQGSLETTEVTKFFPDGKQLTEVFDSLDNKIALRTELFDASENLVSQIEKDILEHLLIEDLYFYEGKLLIRERHRNYKTEPIREVETFYEYDGSGNLVQEQTRDLSDKLISFRSIEYDKLNRVVAENGGLAGSAATRHNGNGMNDSIIYSYYD